MENYYNHFKENGPKERYDVVIMGIGEIGRSLYELLNGVYKVLPADPVHYPNNMKVDTQCEFLHICFPGELENFNDIVVKYANKYNASYILIHATVLPGTTRKINRTLGRSSVVFAPVHGKHQNNQMKKDMLRYPKYLGFMDMSPNQVEYVKEHLWKAGFSDIRITYKPENAEWAKILSTTQFGLVVAWAQEVERICDKFGLDYDYVTDFFPIQEDSRGSIYPGFIGGHCVMPNIKLMKEIYSSELLDWLEWSNETKRERG
jgi:UDP-N-acetyl-D-mannosaminuronate dehydrogenase